MLIAIWDLNLDPMVTLQVFSAITPLLAAEQLSSQSICGIQELQGGRTLEARARRYREIHGHPRKRILANPSRYVEGRRVWVDLKEAQLRALTRQHFRTHLVRLIVRFWAKKGSGYEEGWNTASTKRNGRKSSFGPSRQFATNADACTRARTPSASKGMARDEQARLLKPPCGKSTPQPRFRAGPCPSRLNRSSHSWD